MNRTDKQKDKNLINADLSMIESFRLVIDQAADGIITLDLDGCILYANKSAEEIVGVPLKTSLGKHFTKYIEKNSLPRAIAAFGKALKGSVAVRDELDLVRKDGKMLRVEFSASPIYQNGKIVQLHAIFRDVTKKKEIESFIREAEKMKAIQDFIAGTTQEIQLPLKAVHDLSHKLVQRVNEKKFEYISYKEFSEIVQNLESIHAQIKNCYNISNRLLTLNKKRVGLKKEYCNVNNVIKETVNMIEQNGDTRGIDFRFKLSPNLPLAMIGPIELKQVLFNIINNAVESIPGTGIINLKTKFNHNEKMIHVECVDSGVGIPKENLNRVFEPFFTTKQPSTEKNIGLGLSIVYSIIKSIDGEISIRSSLREGTQVHIYLPTNKK